MRSQLYNYVDVLNARLVAYDLVKRDATFEVFRPYLTLGRSENSNIEIMIVVEYQNSIAQVSRSRRILATCGIDYALYLSQNHSLCRVQL